MTIEKEIYERAKEQENFVFLYDAKKTSYSTGKSIYAWGVNSEIKGNKLSELNNKIKNNKKYFGFFSYDLKNSIEELNQEKNFFLKNKNNFLFLDFKNIKEINNSDKLNFSELIKNYSTSEFTKLQNNYTRKEYLEKVERIKTYIKQGDVYQANLTMKYFSEFKKTPDYFLLFLKLISINPVPFAAFIKIKNNYIISASPELFFRIDNKNNISTCPIKGTSKIKNISDLETPKEVGENLMITDLMRNDLSRICNSGSVKVDQLFSKENFTEYTHLYSNITGRLKQNVKMEQVVEAIFPPGSMTGAPKIAAMNICAELEKHKRGIYSGALGYFSTDNSGSISEAEFSVIIRTIICEGNKFEFQVGGGITYDSNPEKEFEETLIKARPIFEALGIS